MIGAESVLRGSLNLGNKVVDLAFDYRPDVVYASVSDDKKNCALEL